METKDGMIQKTTGTLLKTAAAKSTEKTLSFIYRAVKDIIKQTVIRRAIKDAISSKYGGFTRSQKFAQNIVGFLLKKPTFTATFT